jgi:hypothetical protein
VLEQETLGASVRYRAAEPVGRRARRRWLRELRSAPTVLLVLFCLFLGIPTTVALTPSQDVVALGQYISVGARPPSLSVSGPAQLVQVGNTALDLSPIEVRGPLRPRLTLGPVQRNAAAAQVFDPLTSAQVQAQATENIVRGFVQWYLWGGLGLVVFTLAAAAAAGFLRLMVILRRRSRADGDHHTVPEIWHHYSGAIGRMTVIAVAASVLAWGAAGALAYSGTTSGLREVSSLPDLVGSAYVSPPSVGPGVFGYRGAVIGDSRAARVGGPLVPDAEPADEACERSSDSLAEEVGRLLGTRVLNLACPSATIASGLRGPQERAGGQLPPQVGLLKQVRGLDFVIVAIGPNDIGWSDFMTYCYAVENCVDNLTQGELEYRFAEFDRDYGALLRDLAELPDDPQVIVVTSYDVFAPDAGCADVQGPEGLPGLTPAEIEVLSGRNDDLNRILVAGAEKYGFAVARPPLTLLCPDGPGTVPDLQGFGDPYPFHPTATGSIRMASSVVRWIGPDGSG